MNATPPGSTSVDAQVSNWITSLVGWLRSRRSLSRPAICPTGWPAPSRHLGEVQKAASSIIAAADQNLPRYPRLLVCHFGHG